MTSDPIFSVAVNTCLTRGQICIFQNNKVVAESLWSNQGSHSEHITIEFSNLLEQNKISLDQIDSFLCVVGPGSFTGIRVGVNFCKTMAYSLQVPVTTMNTLDLLSLNCTQKEYSILSVVDAQKNSVFISEYNSKSTERKPLDGIKLFRIESLEDVLNKPKYICGNDLSRYKDFLAPSILKNMVSEAEWHETDLKKLFTSPAVLPQTQSHWSGVKPLYIKSSAAEEKNNPTKIL